MGSTAQILRAIAKELANRAKSNLPKLREGETVSREWLKDGVYFRESVFEGKTCLAQYAFKAA